MRTLAADRTLWFADLHFHWVLVFILIAKVIFLHGFGDQNSQWQPQKLQRAANIWTWNCFEQRFLADTLQPMLNIQKLRLILPQAPEEENCIYLSSFACLMAYLPISSERRRRFKIRSCRVGSYPSMANGSLMTESQGRMEKWCWKQTKNVTLTETYFLNNLKLMPAIGNETMKSYGKWEVCARLVSRAAGFPTHQRVSSCHDSQGDCKGGLELSLEWIINLTNSLQYCFFTETLAVCEAVCGIFFEPSSCGKFMRCWSQLVRCHPIELSLEALPRVLAAHYVLPWAFRTPRWEEASSCRGFLEIHQYLGLLECQAFFFWGGVESCKQIPLDVGWSFFQFHKRQQRFVQHVSLLLVLCMLPLDCHCRVLNQWWDSEVSYLLALHCLH